MTLRDKIHLKIAKDRDCHDEGCPDCLALTDAILSLVTDVVEREVDNSFDWIWAGWNLDLSTIDKAKEHYKRTRLMQVGGQK